jgi:hypothetical protein
MHQLLACQAAQPPLPRSRAARHKAGHRVPWQAPRPHAPIRRIPSGVCSGRSLQDHMHQFAAYPESPVPENETLVRRCRPPSARPRPARLHKGRGDSFARSSAAGRWATRHVGGTDLSRKPPPRRVRRPASDAPP